MFSQTTAAAPLPAPVRMAKAIAAEPPVSLGWWRSFLARLGIAGTVAAVPAAGQPEQPLLPAEAAVPAPGLPIDLVSRLAEDDLGDAAASFWEEHVVSPGESVQVYGPVETGAAAPAEQPHIGRSFLGAYRKGRRAAEAGLRAKHCPYKAKLVKDGRAVNGLTRTFQRYWAEGLNDLLLGLPERYV